MLLLSVKESGLFGSRGTKIDKVSAEDFFNVVLLLPFILQDSYYLKYFAF